MADGDLEVQAMAFPLTGSKAAQAVYKLVAPPRPAAQDLSSVPLLLPKITAAQATAAKESSASQAQAAAWMDAGLAEPTPSGDRQPSQPSQPGHVGPILGTGSHPAAEPPLLPQAQQNIDLPAQAPAPPTVHASTVRPKSMTGFQFVAHQSARPTRQPGEIMYVSIDEPGGRGGLLAAIRRLFGRS
jgi:hypothetical protein